MDENELKDFIIYAKKRGYANTSEATEVIKYEKSGAIKIIVRKGDWEYTDKYVGKICFIGHEIVSYKGRAVWSMTYHGRTHADEENKPGMVQFLKSALIQVNEKSPFRGPKAYSDPDFTYVNSFYGSLHFFTGEEMISKKGDTKFLYELNYGGGIIE